MRYDIIIIGSGLGGLECGVTLSRQGKRVLILERQLQPGGCMQSYKRKDANFDTGLHYVGGLDKGQALYDAFNELGLLELPWQRLDPKGFDEITIEGKTYRFAQGYENFYNELVKDFPHEREGLQKFIEMLHCTDEQWLQQTNAFDYLTSIIHDPLLINVLSGASLKMELRRKTLPLFTFAHGNSSFIESSWRLKGDSNLLVRKLVEKFEEAGGKLICKADVVELIEEEGRIVRAVCADGATYEADIFVSDAHPAVTIQLVKNSKMIKKMFRMRISTLKNTSGMFTLQLRLKDKALPYFNHNKFVYASNDLWGHNAVTKDHPNVKGILISCPVPADGSEYAKVLDIMTPMKWNMVEKWQDMPQGHRGKDYVEMKNEVSRQCLQLTETVIPDITSMIEDSYTSTPLTYQHYNLSPMGSSYGIRKDYSNALGTVLSPRTPVPNLFLTGQSLMLHGLHGVTMTAQYTVQNINKEETYK